MARLKWDEIPLEEQAIIRRTRIMVPLGQDSGHDDWLCNPIPDPYVFAFCSYEMTHELEQAMIAIAGDKYDIYNGDVASQLIERDLPRAYKRLCPDGTADSLAEMVNAIRCHPEVIGSRLPLERMMWVLEGASRIRGLKQHKVEWEQFLYGIQTGKYGRSGFLPKDQLPDQFKGLADRLHISYHKIIQEEEGGYFFPLLYRELFPATT